jgi:hypothetical protein
LQDNPEINSKAGSKIQIIIRNPPCPLYKRGE